MRDGPRLLFLTTHPRKIASTRYRVLAYFPFLEREGYRVDFHPFFPSENLAVLYRSHGWMAKLALVARGTIGRSRRLQPGAYNLIFIHRELFPLGLSFFLRRLRRLQSRVVYDYDDAMFLPQRQGRGLLALLENPASVSKLIRLSDRVIAGNPHLAEYATHLNPRVAMIPTPIDTAKFFPRPDPHHERACTIGWIGSPSTAKYLLRLRRVFERLSQSHAFRVKVVGAGRPMAFGTVPVVNLPWELDREAEEFRSCDIGVYPLWDDEWCRGKSGFKAIQFMASGVPVIASPVGINSEIIQDRVNGFLAASEEEWIAKLAGLIEDPTLRQKIGLAGRKTVEDRYSLEQAAVRFLEVIRAALHGGQVSAPAYRKGVGHGSA